MKARLNCGPRNPRAGIGLGPDQSDALTLKMRSCAALRCSCQTLIDFLAQAIEIDRLGQQSSRTQFRCFPPGRLVAVSRDHDDRYVGTRGFHLRQHFQATHAGHVDIGQDQDQRRIADGCGALQRLRRGSGEFHDETPRAHVAAELLAKQAFDIGLVVDHKNIGAQFFCSPAPACAGAVRGKVMMNSVKVPCSVAMSIVPPCCLTTISWLIDKPSPVPSPAGLVVKNGLKIFSLISDGIPAPLSRIRISTMSPRLFDAALSLGSKPLPTSAARLVAA